MCQAATSQDAHYPAHEKLGRGVGYQYPHNFPGHWVEQQYLPDAVKDEKFYVYPDEKNQ